MNVLPRLCSCSEDHDVVCRLTDSSRVHCRFDRDLTLAGRVLVRDGRTVEGRLVRIERPILRIPTLAIHLASDEERSGFGPNLQNHLPPVIASEVKAKLLEEATKGAEGAGGLFVRRCVACSRGSTDEGMTHDSTAIFRFWPLCT